MPSPRAKRAIANLKTFQPHERHMDFSIAHYPSMKLLLNICMETKTPVETASR